MVQNERRLAESLRHFLAVKRSETTSQEALEEEEEEEEGDPGYEFAMILEEFHHYGTGISIGFFLLHII